MAFKTEFSVSFFFFVFSFVEQNAELQNNILSSPTPCPRSLHLQPHWVPAGQEGCGDTLNWWGLPAPALCHLATTKLNQNQFLNFAKEDPSLLSSGTVTTGSSNKEKPTSRPLFLGDRGSPATEVFGP